MANISNYLETALLNAVFRGVGFTPPGNIYLALYTSNPTDADTGTEVSGGGYNRQPVTFTSPNQVEGKATIENNSDIEFAVATANWGDITHVGLRDASTGGNLLWYGPLASAKTIAEGDQF